MNKFTLIVFLALVFFSCKKESNSAQRKIQKTIDPILDTLRINQLQCIGTHNSYRIKTDPDIFKFVTTFLSFLPDELNPNSWDYTHIPLSQQLDLGVRNLEIDIYNDPQGGKFYNRLGNVLVGKNTASGVQELKQPGMKVLHIPDVDYNTHHFTFKSALNTIKEWSTNNPKHLPIIILLEDKETSVGNVIPVFTKALPFDENAVNAIDQEIVDIFGNSNQLFKPDDLRQNFQNLKTAIQEKGWPMIKDMRGKIIIVFYDNANYTKNHPNLEGRMMFQFSKANTNNAAFVIIDKSNKLSEIDSAINSGAIVRTRADGGSSDAKSGNTTKKDNAFMSGAQIISSDYYIPDSRAGTNGWTNFQVIFNDNNYARINVKNAPVSYQGKAIVE